MKWITHETIALGTAFLAGFSPAALAGVWFGSILPDILDQRLARLSFNQQKTFNRIHRGSTHWFGWWCMLFFITLLPLDISGISAILQATGISSYPATPSWLQDILGKNTATYLLSCVAGLGFGGLMHVLLDMCTVKGIPALPFTRSAMVSLRLFKTGSLWEYIFLGIVLGIFWLVGKNDIIKVINML